MTDDMPEGVKQLAENIAKAHAENREFVTQQDIRNLQDNPKTDVLKLLDEPEPETRYLDLGETNGLWYYGFNLKGREAVLLSDGRILRNTEERFKDKIIGQNEIKSLFDYVTGYIGNIAPQISKETIKRFFLKEKGARLIKPKALYAAIRDKILFYMDFGTQDEIADVLTCWIIATYCYPLFNWFPHLLFNAPSTSGKSKAAYIVSQLSFRGFDLGASGGITPPQIFRTLEGNRGTVVIDEFEVNIKDPGQQLVNQILNSSATKEAYVIRTEQIEKKWKAWKFPIYSPKICCNISGINPTSLTRFIPFKWLKTASEKGKRKPQRDKTAFEELKSDLYILVLENWQILKGISETINLTELNNRHEDNWLPLFVIAQFIDTEQGPKVNAEDALKTYLASYQEIEINTDDHTAEFFALLEQELSETGYYTPKSIAEIPAIKELLNYFKSPAHWIGKKLTLYKFLTNRGGGQRKYFLSGEKIREIKELYFSTKQITHNNTNDTKQHKQHITPPNDVLLGGGCVVTKRVSSVVCSKCGNPILDPLYAENGRPVCDLCHMVAWKEEREKKEGRVS